MPVFGQAPEISSRLPPSTLTPTPTAGFFVLVDPPPQAYYHEALSEYVLPYDAVRTAEDPDRVLMSFLMSTYEATANNGEWDRKALETTIGVPGKPRAL